MLLHRTERMEEAGTAQSEHLCNELTDDGTLCHRRRRFSAKRGDPSKDGMAWAIQIVHHEFQYFMCIFG